MFVLTNRAFRNVLHAILADDARKPSEARHD